MATPNEKDSVLINLLRRNSLRKEQLYLKCDDQLFNSLSRQITHFDLLGLNLGLTRPQIVEIGRDKDNERSRIMETLWKWRERNGSSATYLALIEVFIEDEKIESAEFVLSFFIQQEQPQSLYRHQGKGRNGKCHHKPKEMVSSKYHQQDRQYLPQHQFRYCSGMTRSFTSRSRHNQTYYVNRGAQYNESFIPAASQKPKQVRRTRSQSVSVYSMGWSRPSLQAQGFRRSLSAPPSKIVGELDLNNPSSQIFDKFYDRMVTIISKDEDLSDRIFKCLNEKFFLPTTLRKQSYWDLLPCLAIKNKAIVETVSTFISRGRTPDNSLCKFVNLLGNFPELKHLAEEMKREASSLAVTIDSNHLIAKTKAKEIICKSVCLTKSSFSDEQIGLDLQESSQPIQNYARHLRSYYKRWHPDPKWSPAKIKVFVDLAIIESSMDYNDKFSRSSLHGSIDDILKKKKSISFEALCQLPCGSTILIEGAPGIGKSVLAFELCRFWIDKKALRHYSLLLLLRLRDKLVQNNFLPIRDLLKCFLRDQSWKQQAIQDIIDNSGEGLLIILEGYDELPDELLNKSDQVFDQIMQNIPQATIMVTSRPSLKCNLMQRFEFTHHIEVLGFTKDSRAQYIQEFFNSNMTLQDEFFKYLEHFPKIEGCLYVPINLVIVLDVFQDSFVNGKVCLPETMTELYDTLVRMLIYRHLKDTNKVNFKSLKELPQPALSTFHDLCKLAYDGIYNNQGLVFYRHESFETLGLMQKESQMVPSEGGDVFVYSFLHLTIQEFLAAYHVHENQQKVHRLFSKCNYVFKFATMMRFLAGLTKLESVHFPILNILYNCNIFHQFFEARNDTLTSMLLNRKKSLKIARLSPIPTPVDMYMIGRCIALGQCQWELGFTLRGVTCDHLEMFISGLNSIGEVKGQIEHISLSLNSLGNNISNCLLKIPKYILKNLCSLHLRAIEVDVCCLDNLVLAIPNLINLKKFLFHDNYFKEGEQKHFIEVLCRSKSLQHVSFSTLSPDECVSLLTSSHTLHTIELYQLSPLSIEAVIKCLSSSKALKTLQIHQSEVKTDFINDLPTILPSSHLKSLEFINCAIDSVTVHIITDAVINTPSLEKLNLSDNLIDDEGRHYLANMIHPLSGAESSKEPAADITHQLNEIYLDHNPFNKLTIWNLMDELVSCHPRSLFKVHLSLGWKDYIESLPTYPLVKERIYFERKDDYN